MTTAKPFDGNEALARMRERTKAALEHEAGEVFSVENINVALSAAATKSQTAAYFEPTSPMDLSDSDTAKTMVDILRKAGFLAEWKSGQKNPDEEPQKFLRVSWGEGYEIQIRI